MLIFVAYRGITCVVVIDISIPRIVDDYIPDIYDNSGLKMIVIGASIAKLFMYTTENGNDASRLMQARNKIQWCSPTA